MRNNPLKSALGFLAIGIIVAWGMQSCKTRSIAVEHIVYRPLLINNFKHDTVVERRMTPLEYQEYLQKMLKANFDVLQGPELKKLEDINARLERDMHLLIETNSNIRTRSIRSRDSLNKEIESDNKEKLRLTNLLIESQKQHNTEIARQDSINLATLLESEKQHDRETKIGYYIIGLFAVALIGIWIGLRRAFKRVDKVQAEVIEMKKSYNNE